MHFTGNQARSPPRPLRAVQQCDAAWAKWRVTVILTPPLSLPREGEDRGGVRHTIILHFGHAVFHSPLNAWPRACSSLGRYPLSPRSCQSPMRLAWTRASPPGCPTCRMAACSARPATAATWAGSRVAGSCQTPQIRRIPTRYCTTTIFIDIDIDTFFLGIRAQLTGNVLIPLDPLGNALGLDPRVTSWLPNLPDGGLFGPPGNGNNLGR